MPSDERRAIGILERQPDATSCEEFLRNLAFARRIEKNIVAVLREVTG